MSQTGDGGSSTTPTTTATVAETEPSDKAGSGTNNQNGEAPPEESEPVLLLQPPPAPDGGYGWVIVFSGFMCNFIVDGISNSFGVFLTTYEDAFNANVSDVSWAASLLVGMLLCVGPIVSALANHFGCRAVCMVGAVVAASGFALSSLAKSLPIFILTFGIIGGFGFGMIYLPSVVCVGYYFERRRSLATGIVLCGTGVGMFVFPPMANALLKPIGWQNVNRIFAGIILTAIIWGLLMRPLVVEMKLIDGMEEDEDAEIVQGDKESGNEALPKSGDGGQGGKTASGISVQVKGSTTKASKSFSKINYMGRSYSYRAVPKSSKSNQKTSTESDAPDESLITSTTATSDEESHLPSSIAGKSEVIRPLARQDVFHTRSVQNLPEYKNRSSLLSLRAQKTAATTTPNSPNSTTSHCKCCSGCSCCKGSGHGASAFRSTLVEMLDFSLLKNPIFVLIAVSNFFAVLAFLVPIVHVVNAATLKKVDQSNASLLVVIIGATNTVGRVLVGILADLPQINALFLNNVTLLLTGVAVGCLPFCEKFYQFCIVAAVFGLFVAGFVSLTSTILVELLGLGKLTNSFGLLSLFRGVAAMVGSPLAGALKELTNSYDAPFWVAGGFFLISAGISFLVPFVQRKNLRKQTVVQKVEETKDANNVGK